MPVRDRLIGWRRWTLFLGALLLTALPSPAQESASEARLRKDVFFLASEECEGRGTGSKGLDKAANHIAAEFKKAGLKPGKGDSYFQPFPIYRDPAILGKPNTLLLKGPLGQTIELAVGKDFEVQGFSGSGKLTAVPLVFAGFGVTTAKGQYDDYKDLDVKGKGVVLLRRVPRYPDSLGSLFTPLQNSLEGKAAQAQANQAAAVLLVNDVLEPNSDNLYPFIFMAFSRDPATIPIVQVRRSIIDRLLQSGLGTGLVELEQDINRELKPHSGVLKGWTVSLETRVMRKPIDARNVVGVVEGSGPLANETIVVGAHYDHVGFGRFGSLAKTPEERKKLHRGADDNGSGTAAVMELARRFGALRNRQGRRVVFLAFSGEELGLFGSNYYCTKEPLFPLQDTVFMLNLDMVGRMRLDPTVQKEIFICEGVKTGAGFDELVDKLTAKYNFDLDKMPGFGFNSDHASFYRKGIPVLFYKTGKHPDYHRPTDTPDKVNIAGIKKIVDLSEATLLYFSTVPERPQWLPAQFKPVPPKGPSLGIATTGINNDSDGLILGNLTPKGPAVQAGLLRSDKIVFLAGREIRTPENFARVLEGLKAGATYEAIVWRKGQKMTVKLVPEMTGK